MPSGNTREEANNPDIDGVACGAVCLDGAAEMWCETAWWDIPQPLSNKRHTKTPKGPVIFLLSNVISPVAMGPK